jgi:hypothetical protein
MFRSGATGAIALLALTACMSDSPDPDDPMGRSRARLEAERAACVADGGTFRPAGIGILTCIHTTSDGGKACAVASDCEGTCFADPDGPGGTCSSQTPVFGCYSMIEDSGEVVEICAD